MYIWHQCANYDEESAIIYRLNPRGGSLRCFNNTHETRTHEATQSHRHYIFAQLLARSRRSLSIRRCMCVYVCTDVHVRAGNNVRGQCAAIRRG